MTYVTIDFDEHEPYPKGSNVPKDYVNRPRGLVKLHGPGNLSMRPFWALVDTGCDYLHLLEEAADKVGIDLSNAKRFRISTAGGLIYMRQKEVEVEIQGELVKVPCNFGKNAKPLIGMQAIFETMESVGFRSTEWLIDWHPDRTNAKVLVSNYKKESRLVKGRKSGPEITVSADANYNPPMSEWDKQLLAATASSAVEDHSFDLSVENTGKTDIEEGKLRVELVWLEKDDPDDDLEELDHWDITDGSAIPRDAHNDNDKRHYLSEVNLKPGDSDNLCSIRVTSPSRKTHLRKARFFRLKWTLDLKGMPSIEGELDLTQIDSV